MKWTHFENIKSKSTNEIKDSFLLSKARWPPVSSTAEKTGSKETRKDRDFREQLRHIGSRAD